MPPSKSGETVGGRRLTPSTWPSAYFLLPCRTAAPQIGILSVYMAWDIEFTNEFGQWWDDLESHERRSVAAGVELLGEYGPALGFPHSSSVRTSRHRNMRELRVQSGGRPLRVFYAFDPRRAAILLIGGDKTGDDRFYFRYVPIADDLYDEHLEELRREGLL